MSATPPAATGRDAKAVGNDQAGARREPPRELAWLEPDILAAEGMLGRPRSGEGSRRLLLALLEDAVKRVGGGGAVGRETLAWFESEKTGWGSFLFVCETLGLADVAGIRRYARAAAGGRTAKIRLHRRVRYRSRATSLANPAVRRRSRRAGSAA